MIVLTDLWATVSDARALWNVSGPHRKGCHSREEILRHLIDTNLQEASQMELLVLCALCRSDFRT